MPIKRGNIMSNNLVLVEKKGSIATLTLNRPEKGNALSPALLVELYQAMHSIKDDTQIRVVVITGSGEKAFSAGFDIGHIPAEKITPELEQALKTVDISGLGYGSAADYPYPVIAMINGYAYGAGLELITGCDIRIAVDTAKFGMPPARLGVLYPPSGILHFINVVGVANTKELFLTARPVTAQRAREMGLVNYVVPREQLSSVTYEMAQKISDNAPLALSGSKTIISKLLNYQKLSAEDGEELAVLLSRVASSEDSKEGPRAFLEKRKPVFKGK